MTQIVLHPRNVARFGPYGGARVMLGLPWLWWEYRVHSYTAEHALEIRCEPSRDDLQDYFVTFGEDRDRVVLTDPPSLFVIQLQEVPDFDDGLSGRMLLTGSRLTVRVVWWCQPGPYWQPVPHVRTCRPGFYQQDSQIRGHDPRSQEQQRRDRDWSDAYYEPMPELDWPFNSMVVDGQPVGPPTLPLTGDRCRQCQRYMTESERHTDIHTWGGDLIATLQNPEPVAYRRYGPSILPEQDVVDEIDRLVNTQIAPGPVDNYAVDRYPHCDDCEHSWHGLECAQDDCYCINTSWLEKKE